MDGKITRRATLGGLGGLGGLALAGPVAAASAREIGWNDLIPAGVPYAEIVGEGVVDARRDIWLPVFDENARRFVTELDGVRIRMPGYMLPLETGGRGVTEFILVPYAGACIHVPPPPPNQLIFVTTRRPWQAETMFEPVWVTGPIRVNPISTNLAEIGYDMRAEEIERYEWQ